MTTASKAKFHIDFQMLTPPLALVKRELLSTLRGRSASFFLIAMMATLNTLLIAFAGSAPIELSNPRVTASLAILMFHTFGYGLYLASLLLVPPIAAGAICTEKQQDQLDLVRMTYIRPGALILGKFINIIGLYALIVIATLPYAGVMLFFTGLDARQFIQVLLLVLASAGSATMLGLLCSAWFYRTIPSVLVAFLAVALTQLGLALLFFLWLSFSFNGMAGMGLWLEWLEPLAAALCPVWGISMLASASFHPSFYLIIPGYHGLLALAAGLLARRILRRPTEPMKVDSRAIIDDPALLEQRRKRFPYYLLDPQRRRALIGDGQNPVFVKERYTGLSSRGSTAIRILYATAILAVVAGAFTAVSVEYNRTGMVTAYVFFAVETLLLLCITPAFIATTISKEREWGNWDALRVTLLTPRQVLVGKLAAALQSLAFPAGALLIGGLPLLEVARRDSSVLHGWTFGVVMMGVSVLYVMAISLATATSQKQSLPALLAAYLAALVMLLGLPFLVGISFEYTSPISSDEVEAFSLWLSPTLMPVKGLENYQVLHIAPLAQAYVWTHIVFILLLSAGLLSLARGRLTALWGGPNHLTPRGTRLQAAPEPNP